MPEASTLRNTVGSPPRLESLGDGHFPPRLTLPIESQRFAEGGLRTRSLFKSNGIERPLLSIVTVVFNGEAHIEDAIRSVLDQTWSNVEYIVVDGGSKDRTVEIIKSYDDRIDYWVSEKDKGISDAFNKGISCATGYFVGMINADDWYETGTLEAVAMACIRNPEAGVICGRIQYWKNGKKDFEFESDPTRLELEMTINHPSCFVRRDVYQKFGGFHDRFKCSMDYELMLRFKVNGVKFVSLDQVMANMRLDGTSDKFWRRALSESRQAKIELMGRPVQAWCYWAFQVTRRSVRDMLLRCGLKSFIGFYRRNFSILAKHESR